MSLFDNPMIERAKQALSEEDKKRYAAIGERMFANVDFTAENYDLAGSIQNAADYVAEAICAGQHPSTLDDDEIVVMEETRGSAWYENFGYVKEDLAEIVTIPRSFPIVERRVVHDGADETKE